MNVALLKRILKVIFWVLLGSIGGGAILFNVNMLEESIYTSFLAGAIGIGINVITLYILTQQVEESEKDRKLIIEENKLEGMLSGDYNTAGVIFDLKNNHGHTDKVEHDHTTKGDKIGVAPIQWVNDKPE